MGQLHAGFLGPSMRFAAASVGDLVVLDGAGNGHVKFSLSVIDVWRPAAGGLSGLADDLVCVGVFDRDQVGLVLATDSDSIRGMPGLRVMTSAGTVGWINAMMVVRA